MLTVFFCFSYLSCTNYSLQLVLLSTYFTCKLTFSFSLKFIFHFQFMDFVATPHLVIIILIKIVILPNYTVFIQLRTDWRDDKAGLVPFLLPWAAIKMLYLLSVTFNILNDIFSPLYSTIVEFEFKKRKSRQSQALSQQSLISTCCSVVRVAAGPKSVQFLPPLSFRNLQLPKNCEV